MYMYSVSFDVASLTVFEINLHIPTFEGGVYSNTHVKYTPPLWYANVLSLVSTVNCEYFVL